MINARRTGSLFAVFYALVHAGWMTLVATGAAKPLMDWILGLHAISLAYTIEPFSVARAAVLIVFTAGCGYVSGWILAAGWNYLEKKA